MYKTFKGSQFRKAFELFYGLPLDVILKDVLGFCDPYEGETLCGFGMDCGSGFSLGGGQALYRSVWLRNVTCVVTVREGHLIGVHGTPTLKPYDYSFIDPSKMYIYQGYDVPLVLFSNVLQKL